MERRVLAMNPRDDIDRIREAVDLLELASEVTAMCVRGSQYVGRCPFHEERTPSFSVDRVRGVFHCFGCGAGGDAITFYRLLTGASFRQALQELAQRFQVAATLQARPGRAPTELLSALDAATGYYCDCLEQPGGTPARDYLDRRQVPKAIREAYRLGFSPPGGRSLQDALGARFGVEILSASGLVRPSRVGEAVLLDLFRDRIMFPISDEAGRVVGFGGRRIEDGGRGPKYLNSPNTAVFSKSRSFFGLAQALPALRRSRRVFLVEGYFDVLAMAAASAGPALGLMSASLQAEQVRGLARQVREVVLLLDADGAGRRAAAAMTPSLLRAEITVLEAHLPIGLDPAALRETQGDPPLQAVCGAAEDVVLASLRRLREAGDLAQETEAIRFLLQFVRAVPDDARRLAYAGRIARDLGLPPDALFELVLRQPSGAARSRAR